MFPRRTPLPQSATMARQPEPDPLSTGSVTSAVAQPGSMWVKITGQAASTNRYAWTQVDEGDTVAFDAGLADGFAATGTSDESGSPAYEINGRTDVPVDGTVRVRLWPAGDLSYYTFEYTPASSSAPTGYAYNGASSVGAVAMSLADANGLLTVPRGDYVVTATVTSAFAGGNATVHYGLGMRNSGDVIASPKFWDIARVDGLNGVFSTMSMTQLIRAGDLDDDGSTANVDIGLYKRQTIGVGTNADVVGLVAVPVG